MTVTYTDKVATSSFSCFLKLLLRWRGSIYKLMWKDFAVFASAYYSLSFLYRFVLNNQQKNAFERLAVYCEKYNNLIPVAFVLGFFVTLVIGRWWGQFMSLPWPDRVALVVTAVVHGHDDRGRLMRRTIMRYFCLAFVMTMSSISPPAKKRFPTFQHITDAGFMLPGEHKIIEDMKTPYNRFFMPLVWATTLVTRARKEGRIKDDFAVKTLVDEIADYRGKLATLFHYDWISVPLVYTQVVTLAVYTFFLSCLVGRQMTKMNSEINETEDVFFPVFTFLQFFFYMGWLKVGESLINPFGEDDDDFEVNALIDRHLKTAYIIVDEMHAEQPEMIKDQFWDERVQFELPYTAASQPYKVTDHVGSAVNMVVPEQQTGFVSPTPDSAVERTESVAATNAGYLELLEKGSVSCGEYGYEIQTEVSASSAVCSSSLRNQQKRSCRSMKSDAVQNGSTRCRSVLSHLLKCNDIHNVVAAATEIYSAARTKADRCHADDVVDCSAAAAAAGSVNCRKNARALCDGAPASQPITVPTRNGTTFREPISMSPDRTCSAVSMAPIRYRVREPQREFLHAAVSRQDATRRPNIISRSSDSRNTARQAVSSLKDVKGGPMPSCQRLPQLEDGGVNVVKFTSNDVCAESGHSKPFIQSTKNVNINEIIRRVLQESDSSKTSCLASSQSQRPSQSGTELHGLAGHQGMSLEVCYRKATDESRNLQDSDAQPVPKNREADVDGPLGGPQVLSHTSFRDSCQEAFRSHDWRRCSVDSDATSKSFAMTLSSSHRTTAEEALAGNTRMSMTGPNVLEHVHAIRQMLGVDANRHRQGDEFNEQLELMSAIAETDILSDDGCIQVDDIDNDGDDDLDEIRKAIPSYPHATICANHLLDDIV